jgi:hypothetical protein
MRCPWNVRYDVSTFVSHCDVHGLATFRGFLLCRPDYAAGIFQFHCGYRFSLLWVIGRLFGKLSFGLKPILRVIAGLCSTLQINLVRAISYFLLTR